MDFWNWLTAHPLSATLLTLLALGALFGGGYWLFFRVLPNETILPLLLTVFLHFACYWPLRLLPFSLPVHDPSLPIDAKIPLWTPMVTVYLLAYVQWAANWILLGRQPRDLRSRFLAGETIGKLLCTLAFVLFPTALVRPEISGNTVLDRLTLLVYRLDEPNNLLPSLHCFESWLCLRVALQAKGLPKWYAPATAFFTALVFLSTVLIKQHTLVDLPAAILTVELGLLFMRVTHFDRIFRQMELRQLRGKK